jgi:DNA-binding transcriptional LysR family regulator
MELRHLRYFIAVGEEQHFGRAADRLHLAQPALSRQIQNLEEEIGFELFERLPRGVKLNAPGQQFLKDARRILQEVNEATLRSERIARGQSGSLRIGFVEHSSWGGIVPRSFKRFRNTRPNVELLLKTGTTISQLEAIRYGQLDAGFLNNPPKVDSELDHLFIENQKTELALLKTNPLAKRTTLRLRDLKEVPFVWYPRIVAPFFYDRLLSECFTGGLGSPRIVQEAADEATTLSLVAAGIGVGWVSGKAHFRSPNGVVIKPVADLNIPLHFSLAWRKDNKSPQLAGFIEDVRSLLAAKIRQKG